MSRPQLYEVTERTHKEWVMRRQLVGVLAEWVFHNLDLRKRGRDETAERRRGKAHQYVYEHFAVGKMKHPLEDMDPLFTHAAYQDESMTNMLRKGLYPEFQGLVRKCIDRFERFDPESAESVDFEAAVVQKYEGPAQRKIQQLQHKLRELHPDKPEAWYQDEILGLVLRYECMGGFTDNLHGSVPDSWGKCLGNTYVECFASPFNHKFLHYYSIFGMDRVFGSKGSFFEMLANLEDGLLPEGSYEMNPPWNNEMYDALVKILDRSMPVHDIHAIIVGPNWMDAPWCRDGFDNLIERHRGYTENSFKNVSRIKYVNDSQETVFVQDTAYWLISQTGMSDQALEKLLLYRPGREPSSHAPRGRSDRYKNPYGCARAPGKMATSSVVSRPGFTDLGLLSAPADLIKGGKDSHALLELEGETKVFLGGLPVDSLIDLSASDESVWVYAWVDSTRGAGAHASFQPRDIADEGPSAAPGAYHNGTFRLSLPLRCSGGETEPDLLKFMACMRMQDRKTKNRRDFTLASSATQLDRLLQGEEQAFTMYDQFVEGNYTEVRLRAVNAASFANHPSGPRDGPRVAFRRSSLWDIESDFKSVVSDVSNNMMASVLRLQIQPTEGGAAFAQGLTSWEFGGAKFSSGAPSIPPLITHYALMNDQEEAVRRPFPLAIVAYHLYLHVLHSGLTPDEVLRMDDTAFGQFIAEGCQITRDAHLVSYQSDESPAISVGMMDGSVAMGSRGTENMGLPCGAPQFLGRTVRDLAPIAVPNKCTLKELHDLMEAALAARQAYTHVNRGLLRDDCESSAQLAVLVRLSLRDCGLPPGPPEAMGERLRGQLAGWAVFNQWTPKCYALMGQILQRGAAMLQSGQLKVTTGVGLATSASASDLEKHTASFNGHCFNIGCVAAGKGGGAGTAAGPLKFFLLEGTTATLSYRATACTPKIPVQLYDAARQSYVSEVMGFHEFCNALGQCVNELTRVINNPHGEMAQYPSGGWPIAGGAPVEGWLGSTMVMNSLDSDPDTYLQFYHRVMYMGWQATADAAGCMPVEGRLGGQARGGAGPNFVTGCHPYDLNNTRLQAINALVPNEKREKMRAIMDEAHPPLASEAVLRRVADFWAPCSAFVDVNAKERFLPRDPKVSDYVRVACMESPAIPELVPLVCRAKHAAFRLADKINSERPDSDGIRFISEDRPEGTGFHGFLRVPCKSFVPTAIDSLRKALDQLAWPGLPHSEPNAQQGATTAARGLAW